MDNPTEPIRQDIENIRTSMTDKMEQIESKIKGTVTETTDSVKRMVDIRHQVSEHPWAALGLSVLAGYALGSIGESRPEPARGPSDFQSYSMGAAYNQARGGAWGSYGQPMSYDTYSASSYDRPSGGWSSGSGAPGYQMPPGNGWSSGSGAPNGMWQQPRQNAQPGVLDNLSRQFGDEIEALKRTAVTSLLGLLRDTIRQSFPGMHQEMERMRRERGYSGYSGADSTMGYYSGSGYPASDSARGYSGYSGSGSTMGSSGEMEARYTGASGADYARSAADNPPHVTSTYDPARESAPSASMPDKDTDFSPPRTS